jgi:hypothetical protein
MKLLVENLRSTMQQQNKQTEWQTTDRFADKKKEIEA